MKNTGIGFDIDLIGKHPLYQNRVCLDGISAYEQFECITCSYQQTYLTAISIISEQDWNTDQYGESASWSEITILTHGAVSERNWLSNIWK